MSKFIDNYKKHIDLMPKKYKLKNNKLSEVYQINILQHVKNDIVMNRILEYKKSYSGQNHTSIQNAWLGDYDFHRHINPDIYDVLFVHIEKAIRELYEVKKYMKLILLDSWPVIYQKGSYSVAHDHGFATFSGVYYVKAGDESQPIVFTDSGHKIHPEEGMLVLFPGNLDHMVPIQTSDQERICIAFNYYLNYPVTYQ